ncbi:MAG: sulfite exporter TauE/SafE family protein [Elusimicrobia bacterium]|nr:sulfite exporter TauE/SafE family protein [Elusimicrobiota bacterium]
MESIKKFLTGVVVSVLIWTAPGLGAFQAAAQMGTGTGAGTAPQGQVFSPVVMTNTFNNSQFDIGYMNFLNIEAPVIHHGKGSIGSMATTQKQNQKAAAVSRTNPLQLRPTFSIQGEAKLVPENKSLKSISTVSGVGVSKQTPVEDGEKLLFSGHRRFDGVKDAVAAVEFPVPGNVAFKSWSASSVLLGDFRLKTKDFHGVSANVVPQIDSSQVKESEGNDKPKLESAGKFGDTAVGQYLRASISSVFSAVYALVGITLSTYFSFPRGISLLTRFVLKNPEQRIKPAYRMAIFMPGYLLGVPLFLALTPIASASYGLIRGLMKGHEEGIKAALKQIKEDIKNYRVFIRDGIESGEQELAEAKEGFGNRFGSFLILGALAAGTFFLGGFFNPLGIVKLAAIMQGLGAFISLGSRQSQEPDPKQFPVKETGSGTGSVSGLLMLPLVVASISGSQAILAIVGILVGSVIGHKMGRDERSKRILSGVLGILGGVIGFAVGSAFPLKTLIYAAVAIVLLWVLLGAKGIGKGAGGSSLLLLLAAAASAFAGAAGVPGVVGSLKENKNQSGAGKSLEEIKKFKEANREKFFGVKGINGVGIEKGKEGGYALHINLDGTVPEAQVKENLLKVLPELSNYPVTYQVTGPIKAQNNSHDFRLVKNPAKVLRGKSFSISSGQSVSFSVNKKDAENILFHVFGTSEDSSPTKQVTVSVNLFGMKDTGTATPKERLGLILKNLMGFGFVPEEDYPIRESEFEYTLRGTMPTENIQKAEKAIVGVKGISFKPLPHRLKLDVKDRILEGRFGRNHSIRTYTFTATPETSVGPYRITFSGILNARRDPRLNFSFKIDVVNSPSVSASTEEEVSSSAKPTTSSAAPLAVLAGLFLALFGVDAAMAMPMLLGNVAPTSSGLRPPSQSEKRRIDEAYAETIRGTYRSPMAHSLEGNFRYDVGGRYLVDDSGDASYHGYADGSVGHNPRVVLTNFTIQNTSLAFQQAIKAQAHTFFWPKYAHVPPSVEKLAVGYGFMSMVFAELTGSNLRSWDYDRDHQHGGTYFMAAWYKMFVKSVLASPLGGPGFIFSPFYEYIRDTLVRSLDLDPAYGFSLYERWKGVYARPGKDEDEQIPIPDNVSRLSDEEYNQASEAIYGVNGEGDGNSDNNFLGFIRNWVRNRGNR